MDKKKLLRVAWFSEQSANGHTNTSLSAYCAQLLLPKLAERFEIEIFSDLPNAITSTLPVHHFTTCKQRHKENPFNIFFYQLEDGKRSRFARMHLGLSPGIVWIHDLYLQDRGPEGLYTSPWERSIDQYWNPKVPFLERSRVSHQLWPQAIREISLSPIVLFSSNWALTECSKFISKRIETFPGTQKFQYLPPPVELRPRSKYASSKTLRLASACSAGVDGRAHKILPALREANCDWQLTWMITSSERARAQSLIEEFSVTSKVKLVECVDPQSWLEILSSADVALHMNRSPFGHIGPYIQISLAAGVPVVVTDSAEGSGLPKDLVFAISPGMFESAQIRALIERFSSEGTEIYRNRDHKFISDCNINFVTDKLSDLIIKNAPAIAECMQRWEKLQDRARQELLREVITLNSEAESLLNPEMILNPAAAEFGWSDA